ncbi:MAG: DNA gyrase subunit A [Rhodospirillaceae bacterium]|nr:DNA gyrase subunit A [Rhodospirillaceae bacterium]
MNENSPIQNSDITPVNIEEEMERSYLDYAMSVIVSRALPDVRDGLKPVHRRILYAMNENGYHWNRSYRKSARVVGDVMGKYHPHGDGAIYDAMVRMVQDFSMSLPLVDGQGNFGSMDGDPPAAMRYTEVRMAQAATTLLEDIEQDTVDFKENYDNSGSEPVVLPARFPHLLVNGAGGIAVGMATNIPPHNLGEVVSATLALIDSPDMDIAGLMEFLPGPDFPTGGIILGRNGAESAAKTGRGSVVIRGKTKSEPFGKEREAIIITEIPYQVNKSRMVEQIAEAVREKRIEGISGLRDESNRVGVRVVVELKRDATYDVVLNQLFRYTSLQVSFGVNTLALNGGRPEQLNLKDILSAFLGFREEVITRRTLYELGKARERAHLLLGLSVAVTNIDDVIALIRKSPDPNKAREELMSRAWPAKDIEGFLEALGEVQKDVSGKTYQLSEAQAKGILELRLQRLTALERDKIADELRELTEQIKDFLNILKSRDRLLDIIRTELKEVQEKFSVPRRTKFLDAEFESDIEDLIEQEDMVVTVTNNGYIKRVPLTSYRAQNRGGKGKAAMAIRDEDFVREVFVADTHRPVLFFTTTGMVYTLKVYKLPVATPQARGKPIVNLLPLKNGESIATMMPLPADRTTWDSMNVMFATSSGDVRKNALSDFTNVKSNGKIAMKLEETSGDKLVKLVGVRSCTDDQDVLLAVTNGKCIRFRVSEVRRFASRNSTGVRGIRCAGDDRVVSMSILDHNEIDMVVRDSYLKYSSSVRRSDSQEKVGAGDITADQLALLSSKEEMILTVTENGYGKRSSAYEYRITRRGGQGIINIETSERNGKVVASFAVGAEDQLMLLTDAGKLIRIHVNGIRIAGRNTQGVTLFKTEDSERVVSVIRLAEDGEIIGNNDKIEESLGDAQKLSKGRGLASEH